MQPFIKDLWRLFAKVTLLFSILSIEGTLAAYLVRVRDLLIIILAMLLIKFIYRLLSAISQATPPGHESKARGTWQEHA